jgi:hypothetical protein
MADFKSLNGYYVKDEEARNNIGTLSSLTTTDKTSLVSAINEVKSEADDNADNIGTLSSLTTTDKTSLVSAINEIAGASFLSQIVISDFVADSFDFNDLSISFMIKRLGPVIATQFTLSGTPTATGSTETSWSILSKFRPDTNIDSLFCHSSGTGTAEVSVWPDGTLRCNISQLPTTEGFWIPLYQAFGFSQSFKDSLS